MTAPLTVLSLFAGIGGFDLGLERTDGFRTIAFCEIAPYSRAVLAKTWPEVPCYDDIRTLTAERMAADGLVRPDAICGGFPCQDISAAGQGAGIEGERSGLWREMRRLVSECRPRWVITENSPALRTRGADRVLGDLETLGYACWPLVVGAAHAGAPHRRGRSWILAYAGATGRRAVDSPCGRVAGQHALFQGQEAASRSGAGAPVSADANRDDGGPWRQGRPDPGSSGQLVAERPLLRLPADAHGVRELQSDRGITQQRGRPGNSGWWSAEPAVRRMAYGVPNGTHRIAALGNAVVPQIPEAIGRAILAVERAVP